VFFQAVRFFVSESAGNFARLRGVIQYERGDAMRIAIAAVVSIISISASVVSLCAQPSQPTDFDAWKNRGVQLFRDARYQEAVDAFQRAESLKPGDANIHLYLGTAYMQTWIPGAQTPENAAMARRAEVEFKRVLEIDPNNTTALASLQSLSYNEAAGLPAAEKISKLEQAREWNVRVLAIAPQDKEAHYWAGVIAWGEFYPALMTARASAQLKPADPGPLPSVAARLELLSKYGPMVDDGIEHLRKAIEIDPQYADAMAYLNLLIRERADLRDTAEQYKQDVQEADNWVQHALDTKRQGAQSAQNAPPPPPPPPQPPEPPASPGNPIADIVRPNPVPQRIRINGNIQTANLIRKVDPVCPPLAIQARIQGAVKLNVVISKDGTIQNLQLISGPPLLAPAVMDAVRQWVYRPTLLNNLPVEVITQIDVSMPCGN
jgi:tetratricopeptide (TPR) repeat protein